MTFDEMAKLDDADDIIRPTDAAIARAKGVAAAIDASGMRKPEWIVPNGDAGILISWDDRADFGRQFEIEVGGEGAIECWTFDVTE